MRRLGNRRHPDRSIAAFLFLACAALTISACAGGPPAPTVTETPAVGVFTWDRTPGTVLVRLDRVIEGETPAERNNRIPPCTLFGDGRVVWVNPTPPLGEEVLEAYASEGAIRAFLEFMVRDQQFYTIPDYAAQELPPGPDVAVTSMTLNVNQDLRTVRSYRDWPNDPYAAILNRCRSLSDSPALFVPTGAWVTATEAPRNPDTAEVYWPPAGPFRMAELAASDTALWVTDVALAELWTYQRRTFGRALWLEDGSAYRVDLQVPGISRDAPPAPEDVPTPTAEG